MSPNQNGVATREDIKRAQLVLEQLPELVRAAREKRGHNIRTAGEIIGVNYTNLSRIETRVGFPSWETLDMLLDYLLSR